MIDANDDSRSYEESFRWIVTRIARLYAAHGEAIGTPLLVEPTGAFFPDSLESSNAGLLALTRRIMSYTPLSNSLNVRVALIDTEEESGGGCGSGACGTGGSSNQVRGGVVEESNGYAILLHPSDIGDPILLTASLARNIGTLLHLEGDLPLHPNEVGEESEVTASALGFGVLLASASCTYKKGCGGMRMHRGTALSLNEHALLLATVARMHGHKVGAIEKHLEVTQREAFDRALSLVDSNRELTSALCSTPETLVDGIFTIHATRGWLGRLFSKRPASDLDTGPHSPVRNVKRSAEEQAKIDEMRRLVDEALGS